MKHLLKKFVPFAVIGVIGAGLGMFAGDMVSGLFEPLGGFAGAVTTGFFTGVAGVGAVEMKVVKL